MDERSLASIQLIHAKHSIEGADLIEVADVLGWHVIIKKDEFVIGDKVIYCEVDSILPERPEFEFLRKSKFRIKTMKMRGQYSQGICFPVSLLPNEHTYNIGDDVTGILGVKLYEPPENGSFNSGVSVGDFPSHLVSKTGETRVQTTRTMIPKNKGRVCYVTEKIDGTSATFIRENDECILASHHQRRNIDGDSVYAKIAQKYNIFEKLTERGLNIALQGEIAGLGIQQNKYKLNDQRLFIFNIVDTKMQKLYSVAEMKDFCAEFGLETVPILNEEYILQGNIDEIVEMSKGKSVLGNVVREGIVVRSNDGDNATKFSFKCINPDFLLKFD